jgi:membrane protein implicated in regulation of membrane protease activity
MEQLGYWHWWIGAVALLVLELFAPGAFFLWLGISAAVVGLLVYLFADIGWQYQLLLFSILSVASIVTWRIYFKERTEETDQPTLNRRGAQYIGRSFTLAEPIVNGIGKIRVDDTSWRIEGPDCDVGRQVRVIGVDGVLLRVEPIE